MSRRSGSDEVDGARMKAADLLAADDLAVDVALLDEQRLAPDVPDVQRE